HAGHASADDSYVRCVETPVSLDGLSLPRGPLRRAYDGRGIFPQVAMTFPDVEHRGPFRWRMTMAQPAGRGLTDLLVDVASLYPKVLRSGVGYWTEMVVNASGYAADMVETAVAVARKPRQTREALAELLDRYRAYLVSSGDTLERAILDFNQ